MSTRTVRDCDRCGMRGLVRPDPIVLACSAAWTLDLCPACCAAALALAAPLLTPGQAEALTRAVRAGRKPPKGAA